MLRSLQALSRQEQRLRWKILGCCTLPLIGACFYSAGHRLPFVFCPLQHWTGIPCPTCGMTRSFVAIVQGNWQQAVSFHFLGIPLFMAFLTTALCITMELWTGRSLGTFWLIQFRKGYLWGSAIAVFFIYHSFRLYHLHQMGKLQAAFFQSPLGQILF